MKRASRKLLVTKLLVICISIFSVFFYFFGISNKHEKVSASASGPSASHTGAPGEANCTACHSDFPVNSGTGSVSIGTLPTNYLPNQSIPISVTVSQEDAIIYGFQLTAIDSRGRQVGSFTLPAQMPAQMQIVDGIVNGNPRRYVEHTVDGIIPTQTGSKTWTFNWTAPSLRAGKVRFYVAGNGADSNGAPSGDYIYTSSRSTLSGSAISNFDGDGISDVAVFRPSNGIWYFLNSSNGNFHAAQFGSNGDIIAPGDYDGDGKNDFAVFRPSNGVWYIQKSDGSGVIIIQFGTNGDIPVVGDYDGDLKSDIAVWRPSSGVWYIIRSSNSSFDIRQFGLGTDKVAQGDYDGDGKTDIAVYRPSVGTWYIWKSTDNNVVVAGFGIEGDRPVQGDYDGDGKYDLAVFRPSNGVWYLLRSSQGFIAVQFGISNDKPVPADFDGDGLTDIAVYRNGLWFIVKSSDASAVTVSFGLTGDSPVPGGYLAP
jgi:hypothetical protein